VDVREGLGVYQQDRNEEMGSCIIHEPTLEGHRMHGSGHGHGTAASLRRQSYDPRDLYYGLAVLQHS
jgi:hypothetical protein